MTLLCHAPPGLLLTASGEGRADCESGQRVSNFLLRRQFDIIVSCSWRDSNPGLPHHHIRVLTARISSSCSDCFLIIYFFLSNFKELSLNMIF